MDYRLLEQEIAEIVEKGQWLERFTDRKGEMVGVKVNSSGIAKAILSAVKKHVPVSKPVVPPIERESPRREQSSYAPRTLSELTNWAYAPSALEAMFAQNVNAYSQPYLNSSPQPAQPPSQTDPIRGPNYTAGSFVEDIQRAFPGRMSPQTADSASGATPTQRRPPAEWYEGMVPFRECGCEGCVYAVSIGAPYSQADRLY